MSNGVDSLNHTSDITTPSSDVTDSQLLQLSSTSGKPELVNGTVVLSDESSGKSEPAPVVIHVGDKKSSVLPNGFVGSGSKVITSNSMPRGHRPVTLGMKLSVF